MGANSLPDRCLARIAITRSYRESDRNANQSKRVSTGSGEKRRNRNTGNRNSEFNLVDDGSDKKGQTNERPADGWNTPVGVCCGSHAAARQNRDRNSLRSADRNSRIVDFALHKRHRTKGKIQILIFLFVLIDNSDSCLHSGREFKMLWQSGRGNHQLLNWL